MDMQPVRGPEATPALKPIKDAKSSSSASQSGRLARPAPSGQGRVETPERARVKALVQRLVELPDDRAEELSSAQERLASGFFHSEAGLREMAERLLDPPA